MRYVMKLLLTWFLLAFSSTLVVGANTFPNRPSATFGARTQPIVAYTFRQSQCKAGPFKEDINDALSLTAEAASTSCPTRTNADGTFENAMVGVKNTVYNSTNSLKSSTTIGTAFAGLTTPNADPAIMKNMTIEFWVTPKAALTSLIFYHLVEIGKDGGAGTSAGVSKDHYQLRAYIRRATTSRFNLELSTFDEDNAVANRVIEVPNIGSQFNDFLGTMSLGANWGKQFYFAVTVNGDLSLNNVNVYYGQMGVAGLGVITWTVARIRSYNFLSDSHLMVGTAREHSSTTSAFPGEINFLAFHNTYFDATAVNALFSSGLPNSNPSIKDILTSQDEDTTTLVDLSTTKFYDAENNPLTKFHVTTVPAKGKLFYDSVEKTAAFMVTDVSKLTFKPNANEFSMTGTTAYACTDAYTSFTFKASDGICDRADTAQDAPNCLSPNPAIASICVRDVNDAPVGVNLASSSVKIGETKLFEMSVTDADDGKTTSVGNQPSAFRMREPAGGIAAASGIKFTTTSTTSGKIAEANPDGTCDASAAAIVPDTWIPATNFNVGGRKFQFCFIPESTLGESVFEVKFRDAGGSESTNTVTATFVTTEPLESCAGTLLGGAAMCKNEGSETVAGGDPQYIPVFLQGNDTSVGRTLTYRITSKPAHGKLFSVTAGGEAGEEITTLPAFVPAAQVGTPNVFYLGNENYFTRVGADGYTNLLGEALNECAITVAPGCPELIEFNIVADGTTNGPPGTYEIEIESALSPIAVSAPAEFTPTRDAFTTLAGVSIVDADQDVYKVGVRVSTTIGTLSLANAASLLAEGEAVFSIGGECSTMTNCTALSFFTHPSKANAALADMAFYYFSGSPSDTHTVQVQANSEVFDFAAPTQSKSITIKGIETYVAPPPVDEDDGSASNNEANVAAIAGGVGGGVGALLLLCLLYICFFRNRKSSSAAAAAVKEKNVDVEAGKKDEAAQVAAAAPSSPAAAAASAKPAAAAATSGDEESVFSWEKHIDQRTGDVYFFNPKTGQSQWDPPTIKGKGK